MIEFKALQCKGMNAIYPFVFFIAVFFMTGCENDELVGLEVQPDETQVGLFSTDTTSLILSTVRDDSVPTNIFTTALLGSYVDPVFGYTESAVFTNFRLEQLDPSFTENPNLVLDSAVLSFQITDAYYDRSNPNLANQSFKVYELTEPIDENTTYYSNSPIPSGLDLIGEANAIPIKVQDSDSVEVLGQLEPRQIRIRLDSNRMSQLLLSGETAFNNNDALEDAFKGIVVVPDNPSQVINEGAILRLGMVSNFSKITFFFATDIDTIETFDLLINQESDFYSVFDHDYAGSQVEMALNDTSASKENVYVQNLQGTAVKIELPFLEEWAEKGNILINQALLELPLDQTQTGDYDQNERLLVLIDSAGTNIFPVDFDEGSSHFDGEFNATNNNYEINITRYIQQTILDYQAGINSNYDLLLVGSRSGSIPQRTILKGLNPTTGEKLKLKITYTNL